MGKTHEDDEIEIDLMELFYALKKRILVILAVMVFGAVVAGAYTRLGNTDVQCHVYDAGPYQRNHTVISC